MSDRAAAEAALGASQLTDELRSLRFSGATRMAIGALIHELAQGLRAEGMDADAAQVELEWQQHYSSFFAPGVGIFDIGDYTPVSQWLAGLHDRYKLIFRLVRVLKDIHILNYTIPVVFQPKGNPRTGEFWSECAYLEHFSEFTRVVTYWIANSSCLAVLNLAWYLRFVCTIPSNMVSKGIARGVAPPLAKSIYRRAHDH